MYPDRWREIESVFEKATELPVSERAAYLDTACSSDPELRQEIDSLLKVHDTDFVSGVVSDAVTITSMELSRLDSLVGHRLGAYRILDILGEGGMGSVYKAVRDDGHFEQAVAIKIIRPGLARTLHANRFIAERNILAQLQHPFIARLVDGGEHLGVPYLVMELVEGQSIDVFCRESNLVLRKRLELFLHVCSAVQYAHASLIVHRDLKPSNILVLADATPKLLDFGIAKLLDSDSTAADGTAQEATMMLMTPDYASPEQIRGDRITTASDVYSLGIVLYEILTGTRPYQTRNQSPGEIERLICTTGVAAPSTNACSPKLRRQLEGDLDNILLMALRKEPLRRYASVAQFAEDIRRYLDRLTVIARPDTVRYRVSRFVLRNRLMVIMGALLITATTTGIVFTVRSNLVAQRRFAEVRGLANSLLDEVDPEIAKSPGTTRARRLLVDKSLTYLDRLATDSAGDSGLQKDLARAYHRAGDIQGNPRGISLGLFNESLESHTKAVEILEELYRQAPNDASLKYRLAAIYGHLGELYARRGDAIRGDRFFRKAVELADAADPITFVDVQTARMRALMVEGHLDEALSLAQSAIPVAVKISDPSRLLNLNAFAAEASGLAGRTRDVISFAKAGLTVAAAQPVRREDALRVASLQYQLGEAMSWPMQANEELPCAAIPFLEFAARTSVAILDEDRSQVNLRVQTMSMFSRLGVAQALCKKPEGIVSAQRSIDIYRASGAEPIASQILPLAYCHYALGHASTALKLLKALIQDDPSSADLAARILLAGGDATSARRLLAASRPVRRKLMEGRSYATVITAYEQASNIALALEANDTTAGLREEGLKLLALFPSTNPARSVDRLRRSLSPR